MNKIQAAAVKWLGLSYLVDAANRRETYRRPQEPRTVNTISQEINMSDWLQLLSDSRKLYCNLGPVTGAIDDKATYSVGRAWNPKFTGDDTEWGHGAEKWLREMWYPTADARGGMFDFKTDLFLSSVCTDRDGEIYVYLTESAEGWPQIQLLPAHQIGQRDETNVIIKDGKWRGLRMIQGVLTNKVGRAVAFQVLGETPDLDEIISARDLIQVYDPRWPDQVRGLPIFTHALLDLKDLRTVQGYEKTAAMLMASVGMIEYNEQGAPDPGDPINLLTRSTADPGGDPSVTTQNFEGATAHFFRSNSGSKLEGLKNDRPGVAVSDFMDRLIRNACVGAGWPYELTWDASKLGGANVRLLIAKAMRAVEDRQDLLRPVARRLCGYAVSKAIQRGDLPGNPEWYKWDFTLPARMTADYGRDSNADREDYLANIINLGDIVGEEGRDLDKHINDRKKENEKLREAGLLPPKSPQEIKQDAEEDKADAQKAELTALDARHRETIAALSQPPPAITINPAPVTFNAAPVTMNAPAPIVNVQVPVIPAPIVNMEAAAAPSVTVNNPAPVVNIQAAAPVVVPAPVVNLEPAPAPVVNITTPAPVVNVTVPPVTAAITMTRDYAGKLTGAQITPS